MKVEIELPEKYGDKLEDVEAVEPTVRDQIEVEVLPQVLRMINDAHAQLQNHEQTRLVGEADEADSK